MDNTDILDRAADEKDPLMRLALICVYLSAGYSPCETSIAKPFNNFLGETYELVTDTF